MNTAAEEIWAILREVAASQKETELSMKETDRKMQETDRKMKETDRKFERYVEENARRSAEADRKFERYVEENARRSAETDRKMQETDRKIKEVTANIGRLGNKLGEFVEEMVKPAAVRLFREQGIDVHEVHRDVEAQRGGESIEVDLLVVNDSDVVAIECKSTLSHDDVNAHLARLGKLKRMLPAYADRRVMGAVTGMVIPDNVARFAYGQGLFVIGQSGEQMLIRNGAGFRPKVW